MTTIRFSTSVTSNAAATWSWHCRPGAFERLTPPWDPPQLLRPAPAVADGAVVEFAVRRGPLALAWHARLSDVEADRGFVDTQIKGPFASWRHEHAFVPADSGVCANSGSTICDTINFALPLGALGSLGAPMVTRDLRRLFAWRYHTTRADLELHRRLALPRLRVAVSGASGFLGSALVELLETGGHEVVRIVRSTAKVVANTTTLDAADSSALLEGLDAVVHLAGAGIADGRWSAARRHEILSSRVDGTRALVERLARLKHRPRVVAVASAVGIYGPDAGDSAHHEGSPAGKGFLADVCRAWEGAAAPVADWARLVHLRFGVVLDPRGGALAKMLLPFRLGAGGPIGGSRQVLSWTSRNDAAAAVLWAIGRESICGPINVTAPDPRPQAEFARALGAALHRPAIAPLPAAVVRALFGAMGQETILASQQAVPSRLLEDGFVFRDPELELCLEHLLGRLERQPSA